MGIKPQIPDMIGLDKVLIAGRWSDTAGPAIPVICPADEELVTYVADPTTDDADRALAAAREAFDNGPWPRMPVAERAASARASPTRWSGAWTASILPGCSNQARRLHIAK
jgi:hypothetical protein